MERAPQFAEALHALAAHSGEFGGGQATLLPDEAEDKLLRYLELLTKWNKVFNLTSITDPAQMLTHHLLDSLSIAVPLDTVVRAKKSSPEVLDVGSGGGLPGIPLAIIRPSWSLTLLDSNGKKTAFIQQAAAELELQNVRVVTSRAETHAGLYDVIVSRAFSSLADFVSKTGALLAPGGCWAAMKGKIPSDEIDELPAGIRCAQTIALHVPGLDAERHLLLLKRSS